MYRSRLTGSVLSVWMLSANVEDSRSSLYDSVPLELRSTHTSPVWASSPCGLSRSRISPAGMSSSTARRSARAILDMPPSRSAVSSRTVSDLSVTVSSRIRQSVSVRPTSSARRETFCARLLSAGKPGDDRASRRYCARRYRVIFVTSASPSSPTMSCNENTSINADTRNELSRKHWRSAPSAKRIFRSHSLTTSGNAWSASCFPARLRRCRRVFALFRGEKSESSSIGNGQPLSMRSLLY